MIPTWIILPILNGLSLALDAIHDALAQTVPTRILIINQGATTEIRQALEDLAETDPERILLWSHQPPLPSLAATWNRALRFVWEVGGEEALIINHDVRLHRDTYRMLRRVLQDQQALFVSAVGVTAAQFDLDVDSYHAVYTRLPEALKDTEDWTHVRFETGGPDFSCILVSKAGHEQYPFDDAFTPAYCEDIDLHRRLMLAGEGSRIFSVNLPFLHRRSSTRAEMTPEQQAALDRQISAGSRTYYARVWGGPVNHETFLRKGDPTSAVTDGSATTPFLQEAERQKASIG